MESLDSKSLVGAALVNRSPPTPHHFLMHPKHPVVYFLADAGDGATLYQAPIGGGGGGGDVQFSNLLSDPGAMSGRKLTKEELLLRERMRTVEFGVTSYDFNVRTCQFLIPTGGSLLLCDVSAPAEPRLSTVWSDVAESRMDTKISPDGKAVAFVLDGDIWALRVGSSVPTRLTHFHEASKWRWAGEAKFIIQEEFDRFTGYWWSPVVRHDPAGAAIYEIAFLVEDESGVIDYQIPNPGFKGDCDSFKYPLAGTPNTKTEVCVIRFSVAEAGAVSVLAAGSVEQSLGGRFPWVEYFPRAGWCASGDRVWLQLLDRRQRRLALVAVSAAALASGSLADSDVTVITEETSPYWVTVTNICESLEDGRFIWSSEETGFRQLYLLTPRTGAPATRRAITASGGGCENIVSREEQIAIDEAKKLVFFMATRESPLRQHCCCASYADGADPLRIARVSSESHFCSSFAVGFYGTRAIAAVAQSNIATPSFTSLYSVGDDMAAAPLAQLKAFTVPRCVWPIVKPEVFSFVSSRHGERLYGCVYRPKNFDPSRNYPVLVDVYGGPHVQQVTDAYGLTFRLNRQMYATGLEMIVVVVDNVGSDNRGMNFEAYISEKMGTVEIPDQTEALFFLAGRGEPLDLTRVAITGWSYGGYASLLAIAQQPEVYRLALAAAPVTLWQAYDTGYTERYMGLPGTCPGAYENGSVIHYANGFPDEEGRLVIVHGLQDENVHFSHTSELLEVLTVQDKPHVLKLFPSERHGVRDWSHRLHLERCFVDQIKKAFSV